MRTGSICLSSDACMSLVVCLAADVNVVFFFQAARSLKQHESLRSCVLCGSPARFDSDMQQAVCTRISCAFEFCTLCQSAFHNSDPCRKSVQAFTPSQKTLVAGSTRSKRNVRRLWAPQGKMLQELLTKNAFGFLTVLKDFLKCFILLKCEVNCAQRGIPTIIPC